MTRESARELEATKKDLAIPAHQHKCTGSVLNDLVSVLRKFRHQEKERLKGGGAERCECSLIPVRGAKCWNHALNIALDNLRQETIVSLVGSDSVDTVG